MFSKNGNLRSTPDNIPATHPNGDVKATTITYNIAIILALSFGSTKITCMESSIGLMSVYCRPLK